MTNPTSNFGWPMPTATDLVTDLPADFEVFGQAVDTDLAGLNGGTTGQVLSKTSGTDLAFTWVDTDDTNAIQNAIVTAKGDLIGASASATPLVLAVGADGTQLVADSAEATGLKWATPASASSASAAAAVATLQSTTSTSWTNLATVGPEVTVTTGTKALIVFASNCQTNGVGRMKVGVAISGATTVAVGDANAINLYLGSVQTYQQRVGMAYLVTGLTAGSNTFTVKYSGEQAGITIEFSNRQISVIDMGS